MNTFGYSKQYADIADKLQRTTISYLRLMTALFGNGQLCINGISCTLSSVQREDGSGNSFNLMLNVGNNCYQCYCRTV